MNEIYSVYNMLPKLHKLNVPIFLPQLRREEKKQWDNYGILGISNKELDAATEFIVMNHPLQYQLTYPADFHSLGREIYEDICIHKVTKDGDWLAAVNVAFPNGWWPNNQLGKSYDELHNHIPGFKLGNNRKILEACVNGRFHRYVWGVVYEPQLNGHPVLPVEKFNPLLGEFYIRVETQIIIGIPEHEMFLFILRQHLIPDEEVDFKVLYESLTTMSDEQKKYKKITQPFLNYLERNR